MPTSTARNIGKVAARRTPLRPGPAAADRPRLYLAQPPLYLAALDERAHELAYLIAGDERDKRARDDMPQEAAGAQQQPDSAACKAWAR